MKLKQLKFIMLKHDWFIKEFRYYEAKIEESERTGVESRTPLA